MNIPKFQPPRLLGSFEWKNTWFILNLDRYNFEQSRDAMLEQFF